MKKFVFALLGIALAILVAVVIYNTFAPDPTPRRLPDISELGSSTDGQYIADMDPYYALASNVQVTPTIQEREALEALKGIQRELVGIHSELHQLNTVLRNKP